MRIKDLVGKKIAVHCRTKEEAEKFCKLVFDEGYSWENPYIVEGKTNYNMYKQEICYGLDTGTLRCGTLKSVNSEYRIIPFPKFIKQYENSERFQLEIKQKKTKTVAVLKDENEKYIRHAVAKCSPNDVYDFETGKQIALQRLFGIEVFPGLPDNRKDTINALIAIANRLKELE